MMNAAQCRAPNATGSLVSWTPAQKSLDCLPLVEPWPRTCMGMPVPTKMRVGLAVVALKHVCLHLLAAEPHKDSCIGPRVATPVCHRMRRLSPLAISVSGYVCLPRWSRRKAATGLHEKVPLYLYSPALLLPSFAQRLLEVLLAATQQAPADRRLKREGSRRMLVFHCDQHWGGPGAHTAE